MKVNGVSWSCTMNSSWPSCESSLHWLQSGRTCLHFAKRADTVHQLLSKEHAGKHLSVEDILVSFASFSWPLRSPDDKSPFPCDVVSLPRLRVSFISQELCSRSCISVSVLSHCEKSITRLQATVKLIAWCWLTRKARASWCEGIKWWYAVDLNGQQQASSQLLSA